MSLVVYASDFVNCSIRWLFHLPPKRKVVVLYYHGISALEKIAFAKQMRTLAKTSRPTTCAGDALDGPAHFAAVSFDDGFISVLENVLPVIRAERIPITVFVPAACLGQTPGWFEKQELKARGEKIVTPDNLRLLASDPLVTIGSHTLTHPRLPSLGNRQAIAELYESKRILEEAVGKPITLFSFPHGAFSERDLVLAKEAGYKRVFGIEPSLAFASSDEFLTGRVAADPRDSSLEFRLKLAGAYRWESVLKRLKKAI